MVNSSPRVPLVNFLGALFVELLNLVLPKPPLPPAAATNSSPIFINQKLKFYYLLQKPEYLMEL